MPEPNQRPTWFLISQHWLSVTGVVLVITAVLTWIFILPVQLRGHVDNPYAGLVAFVLLPVVFFGGLVLTPIGLFLAKRRIRHGFSSGGFDRKNALRRIAIVVGVTTVLNILIGTQVSYRAVSHMETPQFCGGTCHVMAPEYAAYQNSPHSRVECVGCHVAPGASGWVSSKAAGTRQLVETILKSSPKPIPSAIETNRLVPARETCEHCHWPEKFSGVNLRVLTKYAPDETNTRTQTVLLMMVGGDKYKGIHGAHVGPGIHIRFAASDPKRQTITRVQYENESSGLKEEFVASDSQKAAPDGTATIEMQCVDCHNRPTHTFEMPEPGLDKALALGEIAVTLPYVKKESAQLLQATYTSQAEASEKIPSQLNAYYQQNYPSVYSQRGAEVDRAGKAVLAIYNRNVFPELGVTWGTYPNNLGHTESPGCFRCHDGSHTSSSGKTIPQDCNSCHEPLAMDEASPEILQKLGIAERISALQRK
ncbi:cytochrome c family protein [Candidatus Koribacter versatilis Ellin345]|uniref:Cytochrome c family protein n=1 Tax=Koribacter versatilis (strain Ellin345) TaxID=204669 RepID=Q1IUJ3_KORVE|nr:NapC/NirT family cytochrome c [Candidatus Koribacter versatilis]ABF39457.1 cytochrome c family protein [Candidatus Koribacter versatilis Ellin345]